MNLDPTEHNRRVAMATTALGLALADGEDADTARHDLLHTIAMGDDDGALRWERLAVAVYTWVGMALGAAAIVGAHDPAGTLPDDVDLPAEVRAALHVYNAGLGGDWHTAGEALGMAIAAGLGYETVTQVMWIAANALRKLGVQITP